LQRGFYQIFQDVSLQNLPVLFCLDRAGLVGSDGAVHHGIMDLAFMRPLPGMTLMAPADAAELVAAIDCAFSLDGPAAIRYPREEVPDKLPGPCPAFSPGQARVVTEGQDGAFLCYGATTRLGLAAARLCQRDGLELSVVSARFAKPLDEGLIERLFCADKCVVLCEDHVRAGGFGSAVLELAVERGWPTRKVRQVCLPDQVIYHASRAQQLTQAGLDAESLAGVARELIGGAGRPAGRLAQAREQ
ncbi:MAG: 1-deoxy-D-xylulose-5-phosphate synthase, partial [Planctomycetes bacterium]|nr:1-deoxy-D-xylulose-5-phosphate synthase [Planctomycetota bacterium]